MCAVSATTSASATFDEGTATSKGTSPSAGRPQACPELCRRAGLGQPRDAAGVRAVHARAGGHGAAARTPLGGAEADEQRPTARTLPVGAPAGLQAGRPAAVCRRRGVVMTSIRARLLVSLLAALARGHAVGAPEASTDIDVGEAEHRARGQLAVRARGIDRAAVGGPDLHHEVEVLVAERARLRGVDLALVAQRQRHLAQLVVEQRLGLVQHVAVGDRGDDERTEREGRQQRDEQARADGADDDPRHQPSRLPR